jgi:putative ABC transport system substrate-binding protein
MRRREFITLLGGAAAWPLAAHAQQPAMPVIGWLNLGNADEYVARLSAFRQGLGEMGYVEGRNVVIDYRWAEGRNERLADLAADLVRHQVAVIATTDTATAQVAKAATMTIPIVFRVGNDPVQFGLVASLSRPGGNLTGVAALNTELSQKRLELLHELLPAATVMAALMDQNGASRKSLVQELQDASRALGLQVHFVDVASKRDFDAAFASVATLRASGLVITGGNTLVAPVERLAALALRHRIPTIHQVPEFVAAGGLMSYGTILTDSYHLMGAYVGRILKGQKPVDLPVEQATKIRLTINLNTAKALGITVPITLLGRADEVID